ncbi:hypothetical protein G9A89_008955 [Geosiphon pyriformis]|nr:hypothetical protein G9A89_008955 [Geosiphon pyriformis]
MQELLVQETYWVSKWLLRFCIILKKMRIKSSQNHILPYAILLLLFFLAILILNPFIKKQESLSHENLLKYNKNITNENFNKSINSKNVEKIPSRNTFPSFQNSRLKTSSKRSFKYHGKSDEESYYDGEEEGSMELLDHELPEDRQFLKRFALFAYYSSDAYCLTENAYKVGDHGISAKAILLANDAKETELIVYFKGNKYTRYQWLMRKFELIEYPLIPNGKVDKKFFEDIESAASDIRKQVLKKVQEAGGFKRIKRFIMTGHSSGGAYALLACLNLDHHWRNFNLEWEVYSFGSPRIGNLAFAATVTTLENIYLYRLTHTDDYVPRLPLITGHEYVHTEVEFWLEPDCDCTGIDNVYECWGPEIRMGSNTFSMESPDCNNRYPLPGDASHNGPYFAAFMGFCQ